MKKKYPFFFLVFLLPLYTWACSCLGTDSFCETIERDGLTIIKGKKVQEIEHGMLVEVLAVIRGEVDQSQIMVWGDPGHLCRVYTSNFGIGEEFIFALNKINPPSHPFSYGPLEKEGDYIISICGVHFIKCSDSHCFQENDCAEDCRSASIKAFPNPTKGSFSFRLPYYEEGMIGHFNIYNTAGSLVRKFSSIESFQWRDYFKIDLEGLPTGVYILESADFGICGDEKNMKVILQ